MLAEESDTNTVATSGKKAKVVGSLSYIVGVIVRAIYGRHRCTIKYYFTHPVHPLFQILDPPPPPPQVTRKLGFSDHADPLPYPVSKESFPVVDPLPDLECGSACSIETV